jgi:hypothetical protein
MVASSLRVIEDEWDETPVGVRAVAVPFTVVSCKVILLTIYVIIIVLVATVDIVESAIAFFCANADLDIVAFWAEQWLLAVLLYVEPVHLLLVYW